MFLLPLPLALSVVFAIGPSYLTWFTFIESEKRLHSLTSREGDWFLDELAWVSDNMLQYVSLVQNQPDQTTDDFGAVVCTPILHHVIAGVQKVYSAIQVFI